MVKRLNGLIAAPFTAFQQDGTLNLSKIEQQAQHLVRNGVRGAFICGTTGEGLSMTVDERKQVAQRWVDVAPKELAVIVHVGHDAVSAACELSRHAQQIGAAAVGAMPPCFFKPDGVEGVLDYCRQLICAAPKLPFYYYHIPSMTGVHILVHKLLEQAAAKKVNIAGVKFTYENLMDFRQCATVCDGQFDALFGRDELLLASLALGTQGAVGSTYNYAAPIYTRLIKHFQAGELDAARACQDQAIAVIEVMIRCGGMPAAKVIMKLIGIDCGPVRPPLHPISADQESQLRRELEAIGFFDLIATSVAA